MVSRRRIRRRVGYALYGVAAVLVLMGLLRLRDRDSDVRPIVAGSQALTATSSTQPYQSTTSTTVPTVAAEPVAPSIQGPSVVHGTTPGPVAVGQFSVVALGAGPDQRFTVLLVSKTGRMRLVAAAGVAIRGNDSQWVWFSGALDALNATLHSLIFTPVKTAPAHIFKLSAANDALPKQADKVAHRKVEVRPK